MPSRIASTFAKLAGISAAIRSLLDDEHARRGVRPIQNYLIESVSHYFTGAKQALQVLRNDLPALYGDFHDLDIVPGVEMSGGNPPRYGREQLERLQRDIAQVFEIRSYSEVSEPNERSPSPDVRRVFISHGRAADWRELQAFLEKDLEVPTVELEQQPNEGRTVIQKLLEESDRCSYAVIVMTGDDRDSAGQARARENVVHEIGFFQGKYGMRRVCLLHEEDVNIFSNLEGLVYVPFTRGMIRASFHRLLVELKAAGLASH